MSVFIAIFVLSCSSLGVAANAKKSHVHGRGHLNITLVRGKVAVELQLPARNVVGFERPAKTAEQRKAVAKAKQSLADYHKVISIPAGGQCVLSSIPQVRIVAHGKSERYKHVDFQAVYEFSCKKLSEVKTVEAFVFKTYPELTHLSTRVTTKSGQFSSELTPEDSTIAIQTLNTAIRSEQQQKLPSRG